MDYIRKDHYGYEKYRVELDGKFLDWKNVWEASESEGFVKLLVREPEYSELGYMTKQPLTTTKYGRVFIVRYYTSP